MVLPVYHTVQCLTMGVELSGVRTYKTLEPGPYWPDNGQAQTTCRASWVFLVSTAAYDEERASTLPRSCRVLRVEAENAGMARHQRSVASEATMREGEWGRFKDAAHVHRAFLGSLGSVY